MRRPFFWPALGLASGILVGRFFTLPLPPLFISLVCLLPFLWFLRGRPLFVLVFLLGMTGIGLLRIQKELELPPHHISKFADGRWLTLEGKIVSLPEAKAKGKRRIVSFVLASQDAFHRDEFFQTTGRVQVFLFNPSEAAPYGSRIRLRGRLVLPKRPRNPGEFDYRRYLADQGIHAVFEAYGPRSHRVIETRGPLYEKPFKWVEGLRAQSARRIESLFKPPIHSLLKALLLGIRRDLPEEFRDEFLKTGTAHLLAISGMNITLVAGTLFFLALLVGFPQKGAAGVGLISAVGYVFLSGAGVPVVRAGWMAGLFFVGVLLEREKDFFNSLFFALALILFFDPLALFQVGFQLSFLSVFFLLLLRPRPLAEWWGDMLQTVVVLIGTFPLGIFYFNVFSWASILANLLAIPLFHLGVLTGALSLGVGDIPFLGPSFVGMSTLFLRAGLAWIFLWAKIPWGYFYLRPPSAALIGFYYLALALGLLTRKAGKKLPLVLRPLSLSLWLLATALFFLPARDQKFSLTIFDSGQNELLHIRFPGGKHWLVNAGRERSSNQARWILSPYLRKSGVKELQGILLTDDSPRHTGGLATLLRNFSSGFLVVPSRVKSPFNPRRPKRISLISGDRLELENGSGFSAPAVIDDFLFLLVHHEEKKFLLVPTWQRKILERALPRLKAVSPVDLLILPACRSQTGLEREILSALSPREVVVTHLGRSSGSVAETFKEAGIPFTVVSQTGALRYEIGKGKLERVGFD